MSTISHIPNPAFVSVVSAGYTIPASRYARAVVNVIGSGTFTINAVTALAGTQNSVLSGSNMVVGTGSENGLRAATFGGPYANAYTTVVDQKNLVQDYFLPAGTIINGTGTWRAVVEEYLG